MFRRATRRYEKPCCASFFPSMPTDRLISVKTLPVWFYRELREAHDRTTARWPTAPWMQVRASTKRGCLRRRTACVSTLETLGCVALFVTLGFAHEKPTHLGALRTASVVFPRTTRGARPHHGAMACGPVDAGSCFYEAWVPAAQDCMCF